LIVNPDNELNSSPQAHPNMADNGSQCIDTSELFVYIELLELVRWC